MTDISPTQAVLESGWQRQLILNEAVSAVGKVLKIIPSSGKLEHANALTLAESFAYCIALETGAASAEIAIAMPGSVVNLGSVLSQANPYFLSETDGGICPFADLTTDDYPTFLGFAQTSSLFLLQPVVSQAILL